MKFEQELFTEACKIYFDCQDKIKELNKASINKEVDNNELLNCFDILLQVLMLYTISIDGKISNIEILFIEKIVINHDVLDDYNLFSVEKITWEDLRKKEDIDYKIIIDSIYELVKPHIDKFILFVASVDARTKTNYKDILMDLLKKILLILSKIDLNQNETERRFIDYVLESVIFERYDLVKKIFEKI